MARIAENVVQTRSVTPRLVASVVVADHGDHWETKCEGGCGRSKGVAKVRYFPVDYSAPDPFAAVIREELTAPEATRCVSCGPFPTR